MALSIDQLGELFEQVQMRNLLGDGKTFPDCLPKRDLATILADYKSQKAKPDFDLKKFVWENFKVPSAYASEFKSDPTRTAGEHIHQLWAFLTREPVVENSSLISIPYPYVVPGGRFREIYYWDSYFTMLGLRVSGRTDLIEHMVNNFAYLVDQVGYIPNGNRSYFLGRSQPPFFSLMVKLLSALKGESVMQKYLPHLEKEYRFWMRGADSATIKNGAHRVVLLSDGMVMNRYWDENTTPRPEAFKEDIELSHQSKQAAPDLYRHLRAAAESGWDFSSRWFRDVKDFASIHTTDIVPVDLNCLLFHLEEVLSEAHQISGNAVDSHRYRESSDRRKSAIQKYCWNNDAGFYFDFDFKSDTQKNQLTLAGLFPLFFKIATPLQAGQVAQVVENKFLKTGGVTTTIEFSGQQWDAPNGWAPLQWITYRGLLHYGYHELANRLKQNWVNANEKVYANTGKMTEKYDVWNDDAAASGGEYPNQDGFGWTNGVYLAMKNDLMK